MRCKKLFESLSISKSYLASRFDQCYCKLCWKNAIAFTISGESCEYPCGGCYFGIQIDTRKNAVEIFRSYPQTYHGTEFKNVKSIVEAGLMLPGDRTKKAKILIKSCHIPGENFMFTSPSFRYALSNTYAPNFFQGNARYKILIVLRQEPNTYTKQSETIGLGSIEFDKNVKNSEMEWKTNIRDTYVVSGVVIFENYDYNQSKSADRKVIPAKDISFVKSPSIYKMPEKEGKSVHNYNAKKDDTKFMATTVKSDIFSCISSQTIRDARIKRFKPNEAYMKIRVTAPESRKAIRKHTKEEDKSCNPHNIRNARVAYFSAIRTSSRSFSIDPTKAKPTENAERMSRKLGMPNKKEEKKITRPQSLVPSARSKKDSKTAQNIEETFEKMAQKIKSSSEIINKLYVEKGSYNFYPKMPQIGSVYELRDPTFDENKNQYYGFWYFSSFL